MMPPYTARDLIEVMARANGLNQRSGWADEPDGPGGVEAGGRGGRLRAVASAVARFVAHPIRRDAALRGGADCTVRGSVRA